MAHYKDSLFRSLFNNPAAVRELYNALKGTSFGPKDRVVINTLTETLFTDRKNDLAATINNRLLIIGEHQSTVNLNMPFRFLDPTVRLLHNGIADRKAIYREELVPLQWPEYFVLYNGKAPFQERAVLRLSDAFYPIPGAGEPKLELMVEVYNINQGFNSALMAKSSLLSGYAAFVAKTRFFTAKIEQECPDLSRKAVVERAVAAAIEYCKRQDILREYWENLSMEETMRLTGEWKLEEALEVREEEGVRKGRREGRNDGRNEVLNLMRQGYTADQIERLLATETQGEAARSAVVGS
jgi:hypothetical protein